MIFPEPAAPLRPLQRPFLRELRRDPPPDVVAILPCTSSPLVLEPRWAPRYLQFPFAL